MIEISGVSKSFGDKVAVDDVSFTAEQGAITYLLGPNGAGKSSLLNMVAGLSAPDTGAVLIDGKPLAEHRKPLLTAGFNMSSGKVNPTLTAAQQLRWQADLGGVRRDMVPWALRQVGLTEVADRRVGKFSLGMLQRLGLASSLLGDPDNLIFDEPSNGLDVDGILWLRSFFGKLARAGKTLLVASHDLAEVELNGDHIVVMGRGRILADMPKDEMARLGRPPRRIESAYVQLTRSSVEYVSADKGTGSAQ